MRRVIAVLAIGVATIFALGIAYASIPAADGTINGCYKTSNPATGALVVIDSEATCPSGYTPLDWNQTGPAGPPGESSFERVFDTVYLTPFNTQVDRHVVTCPNGKQAINGGIWSATAEQAWIDAVAIDPNPPFETVGPSVHALQEGRTGSRTDLEQPARPHNQPTADGSGWTFTYGTAEPYYNGEPYEFSVTMWVGCV